MKHLTHLRGLQRVSLETMADRLRLSVADLRALERAELRLWECGVAAEYARALGYRLRIVTDRDGATHEVAL